MVSKVKGMEGTRRPFGTDNSRDAGTTSQTEEARGWKSVISLVRERNPRRGLPHRTFGCRGHNQRPKTTVEQAGSR